VSTTGTLQWDTTNETPAQYTATVLSNDDADSVTVQVESAIPDGLIDSFEDGDLNEYEAGSAGGGLSPAFVTTTQSFSGDRSVTIDGTDIAQYGSNTLPNLPQRGDTYSFMFRYTSDAGTFRWGMAGDDDAGESYGGELSLGSSGTRAGKWGSEVSNNFFGSLSGFDYASHRNEWLKCTNIRDSSGNISIEITQQDGTVLSTGSLTDGGRSTRDGVAFQVAGGNESNFIDFLVNESV